MERSVRVADSLPFPYKSSFTFTFPSKGYSSAAFVGAMRGLLATALLHFEGRLCRLVEFETIKRIGVNRVASSR